MSDVNPTRAALYYPFPFVQDDSWLRTSLLFWDRLYCIRPKGLQAIRLHDRLQSTDSEFGRKVKDSVDFLHDFVLPEDERNEFATSASAGLVELMRQCPDMFRSAHPSDEDGYFTWEGLEWSKTDAHYSRLLSELGAFTRQGATRVTRPFRGVPGRVYMALLAKRIGDDCDLPVVTDDAAHDRILRDSAIFSDLDHGYPFARSLVEGANLQRFRASMGRHRDPFALCVLTFKSIGVKNIGDVPDSTLLAFREKCHAERIAFHNEVRSTDFRAPHEGAGE